VCVATGPFVCESVKPFFLCIQELHEPLKSEMVFFWARDNLSITPTVLKKRNSY